MHRDFEESTDKRHTLYVVPKAPEYKTQIMLGVREEGK